ncbi:phytanoyl-CoA dioxygenase family protein [Rubrivivax sp. RP6-9]|uniref:phytanoyl-CoA dioxygenase family protein n=1 Tax=Rubrivivax sp. RP6-9 TaxID=3415750 RepID=UPI003CC5A4C9
MLTPAQRQAFADDGYLVLPGFNSPEEIAAVCERARALVDAFEPDARTGVFSTHDQAGRADAALIASADAVHCFFEEEAFGADGRLVVPKAQSINKIGHALHDRDPVFRRFSHGPRLAALAADLGLERPQVWQSQVIFKQPGIGGEVRWHQDATFFVTDPVSVTTFWFALEDAALDNGCLWVEPGGHRGARGVLRERFVRDGQRLRIERLDSTPWPDTGTAVPLPVPAGTLVLFHGLLPHYSAANRSPRSRLAYTLHVTDGRAAYAASNWLQRSGVGGLD